MNEHEHQKALFKWVKFAACKMPELDLLYAIPNGGARHIRVAAKLKAEGVSRGVPDICLPVARGGFHGLYIELKKPKCSKSPAGRVTKEQAQWIEDLTKQGYLAQVCVGWEAAKQAIEGYLGDNQ